MQAKRGGLRGEIGAVSGWSTGTSFRRANRGGCSCCGCSVLDTVGGLGDVRATVDGGAELAGDPKLDIFTE